jgi:hypothetical protein
MLSLASEETVAVHPAQSVTEFFRDALTEALRGQSVAVSELCEFYLVNLLAEFSHGSIDEEPLGLKLAHACCDEPGERPRRLREVGDTSLYLSGFFGESLARHSLPLDYYIWMGGSAYASLSGLLRMSRKGVHMGAMYDELADKFRCLVDVLGEVSEKSALGTSRGVLRLFERWTHTRSAWMARKLSASGLLAAPTGVRQ